MTEPSNGAAAGIGTAMVIDDDEVDQILYQRLIDRSGLVETVLSYRYAEEALEFLRRPDRPDIDLMFLDINMPRMNGFEFLDAVVTEFPTGFDTVIIVMLTTSLNKADKQRAETYEVVKEYINKPLTMDQLKDIVELVRQRRAS